MLEIAADVGAVDAQRVVAVCTFDMVRLGEGFTQVAADEVLIPEFGAEGCAPRNSVEIAAQVHAIDIGTVVVVFHFLRLSTIAFVAVAVLVPVDARGEV